MVTIRPRHAWLTVPVVVAVAVTASPATAAPGSGTTITSGPASGGFEGSTSASFAFTDKGAPKATFTCKLDAAAAAACSSPRSYSGLAQGKHTFTVTGTDAGTSTSDARTWTVDTVAPKPVVAAPAGLRAPVVVPFGERVTAVRNATLATLTLTDGGATVPTRTSCWRASTSVACTTAAFDSVRLRPDVALVPGQHYTASVGAGVVKDLAGNDNVAVTKAFRALRSLQENAPGSTTTWQTVKTRSAAGGSFAREHLAGASASWSFTGTAVTLRTVTGPIYGKAALYVDGVRKRTIDTYAATRHFNVGRTVSGLTNAAHRLRVVVLGVRGAKAGRGTYVAIDGFTVGTTTTDSPALSTNWRRFANRHLSGRHAIVTDLSGSVLTFTFRGTGLTWFTVRGIAQGRARVFIDGVRKATYDDYATSTRYGVRHVITGLSNALHTVRLRVLGTHHKGGKGSFVTVDRFLVA
jgi:hypothetical protein